MCAQEQGTCEASARGKSNGLEWSFAEQHSHFRIRSASCESPAARLMESQGGDCSNHPWPFTICLKSHPERGRQRRGCLGYPAMINPTCQPTEYTLNVRCKVPCQNGSVLLEWWDERGLRIYICSFCHTAAVLVKLPPWTTRGPRGFAERLEGRGLKAKTVVDSTQSYLAAGWPRKPRLISAPLYELVLSSNRRLPNPSWFAKNEAYSRAR